MKSKSDERILREWWIKQLSDLTGKVMREEERRQIREQQKARKIMGEYESERDIEDAYAYGMITERKRDMLIRMWEQTEPNESELYRMKIELLQELYKEQKEILKQETQFEESQTERR